MNIQQSVQNLGSEKNPQKTESDRTFPVLKHRPPHLAPPPAAKTLAPVRAALLKNPDVNLPDDAAGIVTAGLADPARFRMLTETHPGPQRPEHLPAQPQAGQRGGHVRDASARPAD